MNVKQFGTAAWTAILKTMLFIFNIVFFAIGVAFLTIGIYGMTVFKNFFSFAPSNYIYLPFICIGIFMILVGLLSLWCTPKGVTWLLSLYAVIIFSLFIVVLAVSAIFMVKRGALEDNLKTAIETGMANYPKEAPSIDLMQTHLECCGSHNYTDWFDSVWAGHQNNVPLSCCINQAPGQCVHEHLSDNLTSIYTKGCYQKVSTTIEENYIMIGVVGFVSSIIIFFGSVISCTLAQNLKRNRYETVE